MSTHLPLRLLRLQYRVRVFEQLPFHCSFSSTAARLKQRTADIEQTRIAAKHQASKAPSTLQDEALQSIKGLTDDVGLMPETFIRLPWNELPSLFTSPKERFWYEWTWLKTRVTDRFGRMVYKWRLNPGGAKPDIRRKGLVDIAKEMHYEVYNAFANKDNRKLEKLCVSGIYEHFQQRRSQIPADTALQWEIVGLVDQSTKAKARSYKGERNPLYHLGLAGTRIVSNRAMSIPFPGYDATGLRQVIVRVHTRQRLTMTRKTVRRSRQSGRQETYSISWNPDGEPPERIHADIVGPLSFTFERDIVEYVVLQRRVVRGEAEEWKVWGLTEPSTTQSIAKDKKYIEDMRQYEAEKPGLL
ncbi:hypothetical protein CC78DRAFT_567679 [Lojkania enalia]|uniref:Tim44-like domain-containing protein n=1 Tax=Lojkania enalia TaxID=147567 RepID=A0A9P4KAZ2_9PLEO|nr:hypothetical protein CC78DRAFT_567679 [Didymosphaeria enalia]